MHIENLDDAELLTLNPDSRWYNLTRESLASFVLEEVYSRFKITGFSWALCILYALLLVIGLIGNLWVISIIVYVLKTLKNLLINRNVLVFILFLSIVDLFLLSTLPFVISDILFYEWLYGTTVCAGYLMIEISNKLLSTFFLVALAFDRYLAVCRTEYGRNVRTTRNALITAVLLTVTVALLLIPIYWSMSLIFAQEITVVEDYVFIVSMPKCGLLMSSSVQKMFIIYLFVIGFCVPDVLICLFYSRVLCRIHAHARSFGDQRTQIPVRKITGTTLSIIIFHLVCWVPYWLLNIYLALWSPPATPSSDNQSAQNITKTVDESSLVNNSGQSENFETSSSGGSEYSEQIGVIAMYIAHALVYVNSASNWIFYALLNKHLRESHEQAVLKKKVRESKKRDLDNAHQDRHYKKSSYDNLTFDLRSKVHHQQRTTLMASLTSDEFRRISSPNITDHRDHNLDHRHFGGGRYQSVKVEDLDQDFETLAVKFESIDQLGD